MTAAILLGAGFSRNWGGWLAQEVFNHLIGLPEIRRHERLVTLPWQHQSGGGFEHKRISNRVGFGRTGTNRETSPKTGAGTALRFHHDAGASSLPAKQHR